MPSGATLPFVTYKDTGIQSVTSTVTPLEDENVVSSFLSMPSRTYLHGSNDVVIEGESPPSGSTLNDIPSEQTFRIPDDADSISKVSFVYNVDYEHTNEVEVSKTLGFELIKKVEVRVGNQIWQTLTGEDIFARNVTENSFGSIDELYETATCVKGTSFLEDDLDKATNFSAYTFEAGGKYNLSGSIDLKLFCGGGDKLNTFLQSGAPNNDIVVKIFYNTISEKVSIQNPDKTKNLRNFQLIIKKHNFTATEQDYINKNIINNVINTSQNITKQFKLDTAPGSNFKEKTFSININDFSINASHILITPIVTPYGEGDPTNFTASSAVKAVYSRGFGGVFSNATNAMKPGIYDFVKEIDLLINGSSVTGKLSSAYLKTNAKKFIGLNYVRDDNIYCIPLASEKFGTDSLVLSKLSNKKLVITYDEALLGSNINVDSTFFNITAVGTNVVTYVGGECNQQVAN